MAGQKRHLRRPFVALSVVGVMAFAAACGDDGDDDPPAGPEETGASAEPVELSFANSYPDEHPHNRCGAHVVRDTLAENGSGITIEVFSNSQLGPDAERFASVASGDIDIDIQGSSAISASYPEIGALDAAYAFEGPDALFEFVDSPAFDELQAEAAGRDRRPCARRVVLRDAALHGEPAHPDVGRLRRPAHALPGQPSVPPERRGARGTAVPVAFEEVFLALQQGTIDGQENPIPTIDSLNLPEVQSHVSLTGHQVGSVIAIVAEDTWQSLSEGQQQALQDAISETREGDRAVHRGG